MGEGKTRASDIAAQIVELLKEQPRLTSLEISEKLGYGIGDLEFDVAMAILETSNIICKPIIYEIAD